MYVVMEINVIEGLNNKPEVSETKKLCDVENVFGPFLFWDEAESFVKSHQYYFKENFQIEEVKSPRSI